MTHSNPLLALKQKQIAEAEIAGVLHPYHPNYVPGSDKPDGYIANPLTDIKSQQIKTGEDINLPVPVKAIPKSLAHYQAAIEADLASLSVLKTLEDKALAKKTMIATYWPFVEAYINNGDSYPNDVAVRVAIWLFDVLDIERALDVVLYLIKQGIHQTPPKFDRNLQTFACDAMYDWANAMLKLDQAASPYLDAFAAAITNWDLAPPVKSKIYAMLAKHKKRLAEWEQCLALCLEAERVNPDGAGVKGLKTEAENAIKAKQESKK